MNKKTQGQIKKKATKYLTIGLAVVVVVALLTKIKMLILLAQLIFVLLGISLVAGLFWSTNQTKQNKNKTDNENHR